MSRCIAIVRWRDPGTCAEWVDRDKAQSLKAAEVVSVGIFVNEDKTYVRIALDSANDEGFHGVGVIPKASILKMKKIRLPPNYEV